MINSDRHPAPSLIGGILEKSTFAWWTFSRTSQHRSLELVFGMHESLIPYYKTPTTDLWLMWVWLKIIEIIDTPPQKKGMSGYYL